MMTQPYADTRVYELGFHVLPTVGESGSHDVMKELMDLLGNSKGEVLGKGEVAFMELAYPMLKIIDNKRNFFETAYFGWIKFAVAADKIDEIEKMVKARRDILRFLIIKTISEDVELMTEADAKEERNGRAARGEKRDEEKKATPVASPAPAKEVKEEKKEAEAVKEAKGEKKEKAESDTPDDFKKIEGIGPKIAETLAAAGVTTFAQLADQDPEAIAAMITDVRGSHDPASWPLQAAMARDGQWDELNTWQDQHDGGKIA